MQKIQKVQIKSCKNKNGRIMLLSKCAVCNSKKLKFIKDQEASGLLSSPGINANSTKITLVGLFFFTGRN